MRRLLTQLSREVVLVRVGGEAIQGDWPSGAGLAPVFVTVDMIVSLAPLVSTTVEVPYDTCVRCMEGMAYSVLEEEAVKVVAPAHVHRDVAQALCPVLDRLM